MKRLKLSYVIVAFVLLIAAALLLGFTRGDIQNGALSYQRGIDTKSGGPFELSNTTGRYVLTQALVDRGTVLLNLDEAKASAPDVVSYKGRYFSIFTPGVSFAGIPFYILGKYLGIPQLTTFLLNVILTFISILLVARIANRLGASLLPSILSGLVFAFATDALGYMLSFTQHPASTCLVLSSILLATGKKTFWKNILFGVVFGLGALADIPNVFLMTPVLLYMIFSHFGLLKLKEKITLTFKPSIILAAVAILPLILVFGWYNMATSGSALKLAQKIGRTEVVGQEEKKAIQIPEATNKSVEVKPLIGTPFQTRSSLNGLYILLLSNERSWIFFSPVVLLGLIGYYLAYRKKQYSTFVVILAAVVSVNVVLYSMFGDPWGGWAFGPRYLIPSAALLASGVGVLLTNLRKKIMVQLLFLVVFTYSVFVSVLGAITTNAIPPKVEAINFNPPIEYTYERNLLMVERNESSSLLYNALFKGKIDLAIFLYMTTGTISLLVIAVLATYLYTERGTHGN